LIHVTFKAGVRIQQADPVRLSQVAYSVDSPCEAIVFGLLYQLDREGEILRRIFNGADSIVGRCVIDYYDGRLGIRHEFQDRVQAGDNVSG
jgi:hypothetical protein